MKVTLKRKQDRNASQHDDRRSSILPAAMVLLLASAMLLGTAAPATAHDNLISSTPEAESTIEVSPAEITLTFSGEILNESSTVTIEVIAPDEQDIASETPIIAGGVVTQPLPAEQGSGVYEVRWRVVSSDGHPISDGYSFTVEAATVPVSTPTPTETAEETPEPTPSNTESVAAPTYGGQPSGGGDFPPLLWALMFALMLGAAAVGVIIAGRDRRRRDKAAAERDDVNNES